MSDPIRMAEIAMTVGLLLGDADIAANILDAHEGACLGLCKTEHKENA